MRHARLAVIVSCVTILAAGWSADLSAAEPRAVAVAPVTATLSATTAQADRPGLWGTREIRSANLKPFKKWTTVLERYRKQRHLGSRPCAGVACPLQHWQKFVRSLEGRDARYQINAVNRYVNAVRYIPDRRNNGTADYWATPAEFLGRGGDCEDYAIAKYLSLRALGFDPDAMRIVVLQDTSLRIAHAVLVIDHEGQRLMLDNQLKVVVATDKIRHYRPHYSINESHWWLHKKPGTKPGRPALASRLATDQTPTRP